MTAYRFRPGWIVTLAALVVFPMLAGLGFWQLDRAGEKIELRDRYRARGEMPPVDVNRARLDADSDEFRHAVATGRYRTEFTIYLDNKVVEGVPGYEILTPLDLAPDQGGTKRFIMIERGWVPWGESRDVLPEIDTADETVRLTGRLEAPPRDYFTLQDPERGKVFMPRWQNLDLQRFEAVTGLQVSPLVMALEPSSKQDAGLVRRQRGYDDPWIQRHRAYAVQWFGLAFVLLVLYVVLNLEKRERNDS